jgi:hypothetical protein
MHYTAEGLEVQDLPDQQGKGLYATRAFAIGELLVVWGGRIITGADLAALPPDKRHWMLQIDEDLFQLTDPLDIGGADYVNHSCSPNAGIMGHIALVALRPIGTGEEICFDYAMTDSTRYCEFQCWCGAPNCRGWVRADDWRRPELRRRYGRHFSPYLLRRMAVETGIETVERAAATPRRRRPRLVAVAASNPPAE